MKAFMTTVLLFAVLVVVDANTPVKEPSSATKLTPVKLNSSAFTSPAKLNNSTFKSPVKFNSLENQIPPSSKKQIPSSSKKQIHSPLKKNHSDPSAEKAKNKTLHLNKNVDDFKVIPKTPKPFNPYGGENALKEMIQNNAHVRDDKTHIIEHLDVYLTFNGTQMINNKVNSKPASTYWNDVTFVDDIAKSIGVIPKNYFVKWLNGILVDRYGQYFVNEYSYHDGTYYYDQYAGLYQPNWIQGATPKTYLKVGVTLKESIKYTEKYQGNMTKGSTQQVILAFKFADGKIWLDSAYPAPNGANADVFVRETRR